MTDEDKALCEALEADCWPRDGLTVKAGVRIRALSDSATKAEAMLKTMADALEECADVFSPPGYYPTQQRKNTMDFPDAIRAIKAGHKVSREGWNGVGMFIFLVAGSRFEVNRPPLNTFYPEGTEIEYHAHIDMRTAQGYVVPWVASQADMLADDWGFVN